MQFRGLQVKLCGHRCALSNGSTAASFYFRTIEMATYDYSRPAPFGAISVYRLVSALDNLRSSFVAWQNSRSTANALSKLSDHELADIGLSRSDINNISVRRPL